MEWRSSGEFEVTDLDDRLEVVYRAQQGLFGSVFTAVTGAVAICILGRDSFLASSGLAPTLSRWA